MLLKIFRVSGHSMMPKLSPKDKILVSTLPYFFKSPKVGDIVVIKFEEKLMVKEITRIEKRKYFVEGTNKNDSLKIPRLDRREILGKFIFKF